MKRKLKICIRYGKQDNEILRDEEMFNSQKELDCYLGEAYNTEELVGKFDFNDIKTQSECVYSDGGDLGDQTCFTYELVSYESELNEINKEIENLIKEYN